MPVEAKKLKAFRGLQKGKKGGTFVITEGGKKRYTKKVGQPQQAAAVEPGKPGKARPAAVKLVAAKKAAAKAGAEPATSKTGTKFEKLEVKPIPKVMTPEGRERAGGAGAQLPKPVLERLQALGVGKLPAAHLSNIMVSPHLNDDAMAHKGALLKWTDDKGRQQSAYTKQFDAANAEKKWERITKNRPKIEAAIDDLKAKAQTSPAHAVTLLMEQTSLRPGSDHSVKSEGHYGATTLEARHIKFDGDTAQLEFIGKQGKTNKATVTDPALVAALKAHTEGKGPNDRVFRASSEQIRAAAPKGVKLKDFRTVGATRHAERELEEIGAPPLTGNARRDAKIVGSILKQVSDRVSSRLNNTPAMARRSYIAPQVVNAWAKKHGIEELVSWP
jgi:DNA topoisomerase-1